jgi:SpoVK/Ycf46/Vps4 family AAA+-type ATPase
VVDLDLPTAAELHETYVDTIDNLNPASRPSFEAEEVTRLINAGLGMTTTDFENALSRALVRNRAKLPNVSLDDLATTMMALKTEVVKRSEVLEVMPSGSMDDVGGLENLKTWTAQRRHCFTAEAREFGVDVPKGCALIGPPGTGKSLSAKAIAYELGIPLIKFDVSRVFSSLVGQSEGKVRAALKQVDAMAPCVAMLDELDKAFDMNSGGGDSGVGKRVLGSILTHMQESDKPVFWVMTANRVDGLPPEMLRKGRLDEVFSVSVPEDGERMEVLRIHLAKPRLGRGRGRPRRSREGVCRVRACGDRGGGAGGDHDPLRPLGRGRKARRTARADGPAYRRSVGGDEAPVRGVPRTV